LNARFGNPLVEISFARNGRPTNARIIESSGDTRLDEPILDSLYRWRAKGKKLDDLKGEETFDVKLRILLR
jgi:TonB family protein